MVAKCGSSFDGTRSHFKRLSMIFELLRDSGKEWKRAKRKTRGKALFYLHPKTHQLRIYPPRSHAVTVSCASLPFSSAAERKKNRKDEVFDILGTCDKFKTNFSNTPLKKDGDVCSSFGWLGVIKMLLLEISRSFCTVVCQCH